MDLLPILILFVVILIIFAGVRWLVQKLGCTCHRCAGRMAPFDELDESQKEQILSYFQEYEHREPDTKSIFVCPRCDIVYDDFSGEKKSMEGEARSFCKVCGSPDVWYLGDYVFGSQIPTFCTWPEHR